MTGIFDKVSKDILENDDFKNDKETLFKYYVQYLSGEKQSFEKSFVKRLMTCIQYFCKSNDQNTRIQGTVFLAILLDIASSEYPEIIPIAENIFVESGDFPNITLLGERFSEINSYTGFYLNAKHEYKRELNSVSEINFPLTDYQRLLWKNLQEDKDVITVAPTSAGKTLIILTYLVQKVAASNEGIFVAIVVPTRALISEIASKVYELTKKYGREQEIEICTIPRVNKMFSEKTIFVMTQERLYELIQSGDLSFNYLFIDEAHNISDSSRGVLLHLTLQKLLENSLPQIIVSMPSESYQNTFNSIFNEIEFHKEITRQSPVAKILISVNLVGREIELSLKNSEHVVRIPKEFKGNKLADIVMRLGSNESNIIYRNRTDYCEDAADEIAERINDFEVTDSLEEAADYIEKFVHEEFSLADNLRKGVAFHYGPLPSSVRVLVETLVKEGEVNFIVCTSTLAEGVNLPAKNLFLQNPMQMISFKPSERLEDVKISNITGRAGRMLQHFSGNIFLVEPNKWSFKDYFDESKPENKIPSFYKTLNDELENVLIALSGEYPHSDSEQYRFYTIANKLIREYSNDDLKRTLASDDLDLNNSEFNSLLKSIKKANDSLIIAPLTLEANPTVGYIQQNKLFRFLETLDGYEEWTLPHPNSSSLYESLKSIATILNQLGIYINSKEYSIEYICLIATKWVSGKSLKEIVSEQISYDKNEHGIYNVNKSVRDVIKVINNDIRFRLRNSISCYHLLLTNVLLKKSINISSVKLHNYLEIGASDEQMINYINMGLSREAAKELYDLKISDVKSLYQLVSLLDKGMLASLHPVTQKEIRALAN